MRTLLFFVAGIFTFQATAKISRQPAPPLAPYSHACSSRNTIGEDGKSFVYLLDYRNAGQGTREEALVSLNIKIYSLPPSVHNSPTMLASHELVTLSSGGGRFALRYSGGRFEGTIDRVVGMRGVLTFDNGGQVQMGCGAE